MANTRRFAPTAIAVLQTGNVFVDQTLGLRAVLDIPVFAPSREVHFAPRFLIDARDAASYGALAQRRRRAQGVDGYSAMTPVLVVEAARTAAGGKPIAVRYTTGLPSTTFEPLKQQNRGVAFARALIVHSAHAAAVPRPVAALNGAGYRYAGHGPSPC
jgi:hypothetical protein